MRKAHTMEDGPALSQSQSPDRDASPIRRPSPERRRERDSSVHSEDLPETSPEPSLSEVSDKDEPESQSEPTEEKESVAYDDEEFQKVVFRALTTLRTTLAKKENMAKYTIPYTFVKLDDDLKTDMFQLICENWIAQDEE